jgi:hypothetical protein
LISRLANEGDSIPIEDVFSIENLFALSIKIPWFIDIDNYLATRTLPQHLSPRERQ